jgi:hypothetical protein
MGSPSVPEGTWVRCCPCLRTGRVHAADILRGLLTHSDPVVGNDDGLPLLGIPLLARECPVTEVLVVR